MDLDLNSKHVTYAFIKVVLSLRMSLNPLFNALGGYSVVGFQKKANDISCLTRKGVFLVGLIKSFPIRTWGY